jgi:hypothetical protein
MAGKRQPKRWIEHGQTRRLGDLKPHPNNSRLHSPEQVEQIVASMGEWEWTSPILIDEEGTIIAGHGRMAAGVSKYGEDFSAPVSVVHGWSDAEKRAYVIADNQLALNATWDFAVLRTELVELEQADFPLDLLGFSVGELQNINLDRLLGDTDPNAEWKGMPEFEAKDKTAFKSVVVHFKDQAAVDAFVKAVSLPITEKTRFLWYPDTEIETYADKQYAQK